MDRNVVWGSVLFCLPEVAAEDRIRFVCVAAAAAAISAMTRSDEPLFTTESDVADVQ